MHGIRLTRLAVDRFRNLETAELDTAARFVVLHGDNGQGKTNALEAVWLLATLRPLRARRLGELVRWGAEAAAVAGDVEQDGRVQRHKVILSADRGRRALVDGQPVSDLADYFSGVRAIAFTPSDAEIVSGPPAARRRWLDRAAFTAAPEHLEVVRAHRRVLSQKSAALREPRSGVLDVLDDRLAREGARLAWRRHRVLESLGPHAQEMYEAVAGVRSRVELRYRTAARGGEPAEREEALRRAMARSREEEIRRGHALVGPQRDEVVVTLDGQPARTFASQGQVRSLVLALKLAELAAAADRHEAPLFLLDDLSSELDRGRTRRLVEVLEGLRAQVLLTTTDPFHIGGLPAADTLRVEVREGVLEPG